MNLRRLLICLLFLGSPLPAAAQTVQEQIITQLNDQGFDQMTVNRTLLGRVRIVARRGDLERELVFNPQTGEILRDLWVTLAPDGARNVRPQIADPDARNGQKGDRSSVDDSDVADDDDTDDNDDDDDNDSDDGDDDNSDDSDDGDSDE